MVHHIKITVCSCRGPNFNSLYLHAHLKRLESAVPEDLTPSFRFFRALNACGAHTYNIWIIPTHIKLTTRPACPTLKILCSCVSVREGALHTMVLVGLKRQLCGVSPYSFPMALESEFRLACAPYARKQLCSLSHLLCPSYQIIRSLDSSFFGYVVETVLHCVFLLEWDLPLDHGQNSEESV